MSMQENPSASRERRAMYWRSTLRLTFALLLVWFLISFVATYFARELSFKFFGWPFSYWLAAQGAPLVYVAIIGLYARKMNRLDIEYKQAERQD